MKLHELAGEGPLLESDGDARDIIGAALGDGAELVIVPATRFSEAFFDLSTRLAGEFIQKLVNYRLRLAIVGDISARVAKSQSLAAFVAESNRGSSVWFATNMDALKQRLDA